MAAVRKLAQSRGASRSASAATSPAVARTTAPPASPVVAIAPEPELAVQHTRSLAVRQLAAARSVPEGVPPVPHPHPQPVPEPEPEPEPELASMPAAPAAEPGQRRGASAAKAILDPEGAAEDDRRAALLWGAASARRTTSASISTTATIDHGAMPSVEERYSDVASGETHLALIDSTGRLFTTAFGSRARVTAFGRRPETYGELGTGRQIWSHRKREQTLETFKRYDTDGDGEISRAELRSMLGDMDMRVDEDYLSMALQQFDTDQSGILEFDEFEKLLSFLRKDGVIAPQLVSGPLGRERRVVQVACGDQHTAAVADNGTLWTFGRGGGRLGLESPANAFEPRLVQGDLKDEFVVSASCGELHTAIRTRGGAVFTFGRGSDGQLGHGDGITRMLPAEVEGALKGERAIRVQCGMCHVAVVVEDGRLFTFGRGGGRLGHTTMDNVLEPTVVEALLSAVVREVACGAMHTAVVCDDGALYTFGRGSEGQLGHAGASRALLPTKVTGGALREAAVVGVDCGEQHTAAVTLEGHLVSFGLGDPVPTRATLPDSPDGSRGHGLAKFGCGRSFTAMLRNDGHLFTIGHTPREEAARLDR